MPAVPDLDDTPLAPPGRLLLAGEARAALQGGRLALRSPRLLAARARARRGPHRTVIVLPGLGTSDLSTTAIRAFLTSCGHDVHGWGQGRNQGRFGTVLPKLVERLEGLRAQSADGGGVHLVGWSLGGTFARELARGRPDLVAQLITMGTPVVGGPQYTAFHRRWSPTATEQLAARIEEAERRPIEPPLTVIYSKRDGVVAWRASLDRTTAGADHREVTSTHLGLGVDPDVWKLLVDKLAADVR